MVKQKKIGVRLFYNCIILHDCISRTFCAFLNSVITRVFVTPLFPSVKTNPLPPTRIAWLRIFDNYHRTHAEHPITRATEISRKFLREIPTIPLD